jgi:hypothetical protein
VASLAAIEAAALAGAEVGTRLEVVFEPTGPAWLTTWLDLDERGDHYLGLAGAQVVALAGAGGAEQVRR